MLIAKPWLSCYPAEVPATVEYPRVPLTYFLEKSAQDYPQNYALSFMGKRMTYQELLTQSYRFAHVLRARGVQKGDRIAIMLPNIPQTIIAFYGAIFAGAVVVMTNPLYTERELTHQLNDSGAVVIVTLDLLYNRVLNVKSNTKLLHVFLTSIRDFLPPMKKALYPIAQKFDKKAVPVPAILYQDGVVNFVRALKQAQPDPIHIEANWEEELAILQYTGGTTGLAKGVMLTHRNLVANAVQCKAVLYKMRQGQEKILGVLPLFHVYGLTTVINCGVQMAAEIVLVPRFDVKQILQLIQKERPTIFPGAPTMYIGLINHPDIKNYDLSSIEACVSGSAPLPLEVQERFEEITGGKLVEGYGLTETSPVTHSNNLWERRVNSSIGLPWPDTEACIIDPATDEAMPPNQIGELAVRGPQIMKGYWNRPEDTAMVLKDGWLLTGDIAYMDEEGFFYIVDRKKDMIIAGGFNIYPREVEEVLFEHSAIQEAAVVGIPDPYRGETVKAFIVVKDSYQVTEDELNAFCRQRLASYKVPRSYEFREELPKTMVGKVLRRHLQEEEKKRMELESTSKLG
ncbi:AMP-binding protein [Brevibacillus laterosporus]|uniref:AMP-binding protein n=1 Tax=Brevibacillus laterosporus TaxID=1465 RepID=UPI0003725355|nr:AMP-binding protein [Brevibacillus laterosporus]ATO50480.1 long-chain fatty acid--CoA ligase [Brevibacillus laterosporus DSM 25]MBG9773367.1 long-chain fatty acid--CoA ligase [Brevibacillus laterosporus]MBG9802555.1 long-chain fatty acid--CoA ligase [Brevibacillus laterosporus]MCG7316139.1 AMP-binding protein [Brevibacillus laterosporus]MCR8937337.1 AMP-binding protein [Brevibacillus laterosporus]